MPEKVVNSDCRPPARMSTPALTGRSGELVTLIAAAPDPPRCSQEGPDDEETAGDAARLMADSDGRDRRRTTAGGKADETYVPI